MIDTATALAQLEAAADPAKAPEMAAYHKAGRRYLGVTVPEIDALAKAWREEVTAEERLALAEGLWRSDVHEGRVAAAKLLTQARIRPDEAVWQMICGWVPEFDAWAIADHACKAGEKRVMADLARLDTVESWTQSPLMWQRRAALVITLPLTKLNFPKPAELEARERVLGWAAGYVQDGDWFIQKAIAWWLRDLSKHDAARVEAFLAEHGAGMKAFARKEAAKHLPR
ncbi:DNA alkylation repair protein [Gemmobacter lutimaris]|uniref:DNA alkylation repair protein n=1 Tax=Gemmobacter lutimaris TaxID=2306023 RepID=A0A398BWN6_9RHOB|nr:DNA alkylation repair protein [Gemmobacter lutimaris]RID93897.1 DNA alkylation repair protein [Gemmobacter lutimaris]